MSKLYGAIILMTMLIAAVMASGEPEVPNVAWLHTVGLGNDDWAGGIAFDHAGDIYIAGGSGSLYDYYNITGYVGAILVKLNAKGELQWTVLWGSGEGMRVAVDPQGNVLLAGHTGPNSTEAFLAKFNSAGFLQWNTVWGTPGTLGWIDGWYMEGLAVDAYGNVYVSGTASYPPEYAFLSKFDSAGDLDWSKVWNYANMSTGASSVAVDAAGNIYTAGYTRNDTFLAHFNSKGVSQWDRVLGEDNLQVRIREIALDTRGNIYGAGDSTLWTGPSELNSSHVLLAKFGPNGSKFWAKTLRTPPAGDLAYGLAIDAHDDPYLVGDRWISVGEGQKDMFLAKFASDGGLYWDIGRFGRCYLEHTYCDIHSVGIAVDPSGDIYLGGTVDNALPEAYPPTKLSAVVTDSNITMNDLPPAMRDPGFAPRHPASKTFRVDFGLDGSSRNEIIVVKLQEHAAATPTTTVTTETTQTIPIMTAPIPFLDFPAILGPILLGLFVVAGKRRRKGAR